MQQEGDGDTSARGRIGHEIFDRVETLVGQEGLSRTQAFQRISDESGRRAGTVAANYYRVARQRGAELQPRSPRGGGGRRRRSGSSDAGVEQALSKAQDALRELSDVVKRQEKELATLRQQSEQYQRLKSLVSKSL